MEKLFALLIESGVIYSAIWVSLLRRSLIVCTCAELFIRCSQAVVVAFQFYQYKYSHTFSTISTTEYGFMDTFGAIMSGALVPVIVCSCAIELREASSDSFYWS